MLLMLVSISIKINTTSDYGYFKLLLHIVSSNLHEIYQLTYLRNTHQKHFRQDKHLDMAKKE